MQTEQELLGALPKLRIFAVSLSRNTERADDLVQETVAKALANINSFVPGSNMMAWLYTILRNEFYSTYRKHSREVQDEDDSHADKLVSFPTQEGYVHLLEVRDAMDRLPADHREALILVGALGFSYGDASGQSGCAVGTMKSRVSRARGRLDALLAEPRSAPALALAVAIA
jgi:RNA polymerase sigma-70 factor (ECF subfamily)